MKKFSRMVFDDQIHGATTVYTSSAHNDILGGADKLCIQAVVDEVDVGATSPKVTVAIEHSADTRFWAAKTPGTPEINAQSTPSAQTTVLVGSDNGGSPSLCLARLAITLSATAGTPSAHVRIHVTGRDL